jgi:hypothetical protein
MRLNILDEAPTKDENSACVWEYYMVILFMPGGYLLLLES